MSGNFIIVVSAIYLYVAAEQWYKGNAWLGVVFFSYALANFAMYQLAAK